MYIVSSCYDIFMVNLPYSQQGITHLVAQDVRMIRAMGIAKTSVILAPVKIAEASVDFAPVKTAKTSVILAPVKQPVCFVSS